MIELIQLSIFFAFFFPTFFMVRKVFGKDELRFAGYAMALISALTVTFMLTNPSGFFSSLLSLEILPLLFIILFLGFCFVPVVAFMAYFFVSLKERVRLYFIQRNLENEIPLLEFDQVQVESEEELEISDVGKEQISRLIRSSKKNSTPERKKSGYVFIRSEYAEAE